jgi:hypothetical protein
MNMHHLIKTIRITRATAADHARDWRIMQPTWAL